MPTDAEIGCFLVGVILAFYGFVDGVFNFFDWRRDEKLLRTGIETTGKITDAATYPQIENVNSGQYRFYAEFKAADNTTHVAASHFASSSPEKFLNTEVAVIYDPKNPDHSRFKNDIRLIREVAINISVFLIGLGLIIYAAL
ncbi:MAG TPA: DUF3592 domain-containing protein [Syntrophales bacterium]|mgnify:CR=1 FL=1|jgi:hypothetical protein|nr:DUF3592 domain-containing protein [Syntrophales bacterium]